MRRPTASDVFGMTLVHLDPVLEPGEPDVLLKVRAKTLTAGFGQEALVMGNGEVVSGTIEGIHAMDPSKTPQLPRPGEQDRGGSEERADLNNDWLAG